MVKVDLLLFDSTCAKSDIEGQVHPQGGGNEVIDVPSGIQFPFFYTGCAMPTTYGIGLYFDKSLLIMLVETLPMCLLVEQFSFLEQSRDHPCQRVLLSLDIRLQTICFCFSQIGWNFKVEEFVSPRTTLLLVVVLGFQTPFQNSFSHLSLSITCTSALAPLGLLRESRYGHRYN